MSFQDKTEAPSQHKRDEARKEGRVAKSVDLNSALPMLAGLVVMRAVGPFMMSETSNLMRRTFANCSHTELSVRTIGPMMGDLILRIFMLSMPIVVAVGAVGLVVNVMQVGMKIAPKSIAPDMSKISLLKGIPKLVSTQSMVELIKSVLKLVIVGYVVYSFLRGEYPSLIRLAEMPLDSIGSRIAELCWGVLIRATGAMLVLGLLDYMYQRIHFENTLKMTKQEVKEEYKRTEGDPFVKGQVRQRQREMARRKRMLSDVPKADVVITNPTHIAVALKYDSSKTSAPIVLAKGQRLMAQKIKEIARASGVTIVENKPVARMLFKVVEIGQPIPEELYQAVAEILAYVYKISRRQGMHR